MEWTVDDFGVKPVRLEELQADGPEESARIIEAILSGQAGPGRRIVLANAAAALSSSRRPEHCRKVFSRLKRQLIRVRALHILEQLRAVNDLTTK